MLPAPDPDLGQSDASLVVGIQREVARLREGLDRIEADLRRFESTSPMTAERSRPDRYYEVLVGVYEHGRHGVDAAGLAALAQTHGYDRRGLNGYFTGARAALVRRDGRVLLTAEGHRLVDLHLRKVSA